MLIMLLFLIFLRIQDVDCTRPTRNFIFLLKLSLRYHFLMKILVQGILRCPT